MSFGRKSLSLCYFALGLTSPIASPRARRVKPGRIYQSRRRSETHIGRKYDLDTVVGVRAALGDLEGLRRALELRAGVLAWNASPGEIRAASSDGGAVREGSDNEVRGSASCDDVFWMCDE